MPLWELTSGAISEVLATSFQAEAVTERARLQGVLRDRIEVLDSDLFVIDEEFSSWDESNRRIDLL